MPKQIKLGDEAREALQSGINQLAAPVIVTLGPKGGNVAQERVFGVPTVTHDGVTVAKDIILPDPFENMGAQMVIDAASRTNDGAGDGTTTATLLTQAIVNQGNKFIVAGANPRLLRDGVEAATNAVIKEIRKLAKPIKNKDEIVQIAKISAQNDLIGEKIAEAIEKVGKEGVVTVEEGNSLEIEVDYREGMEFDKGYTSAYFITDQEKGEAELKDANILITDKRLSTLADVQPFLEAFVKLGKKNLVIIGNIVEGDALKVLVVNKLSGSLNSMVVQAPFSGDRQKAIMEDIAFLTGGKFISEEAGDSLDGVEVDGILGRADSVWADKDTCRIVGGKGKEIEARADLIRGAIENAKSAFEKEVLKERLAKLTSGVAVISVGAIAEAELKEKKEQVKDAVSATKAAIEEGIVPGGGVTLLNARNVINKLKLKGDAVFGAKMVYEALERPVYMILDNAGEKPDAIIAKLMTLPVGEGYDVMTQKYGDMYQMGVIDPAKVTRLALQNAASIAGSVLTTKALVSELPPEQNGK